MKDRVLVQFESKEEAKKVEETMKTGYVDAAVENLVQWLAAEDDLVETYGRLARTAKDERERNLFTKLQAESEETKTVLTNLLAAFEKLDGARVDRIAKLTGQ